MTMFILTWITGFHSNNGRIICTNFLMYCRTLLKHWVKFRNIWRQHPNDIKIKHTMKLAPLFVWTILSFPCIVWYCKTSQSTVLFRLVCPPPWIKLKGYGISITQEVGYDFQYDCNFKKNLSNICRSLSVCKSKVTFGRLKWRKQVPAQSKWDIKNIIYGPPPITKTNIHVQDLSR